MADSPIGKKLQEMLNEEKWTRATLSGYTVNQIKELDVLFREAEKEKVLTEVSEICSEHIGHSKNSIAALYLSGIVALSCQQIDDSNMVSLINIFADNHKWNIVEYICERILEYGDNKNALIRLAECYENDDNEDKKFETWERLIKVDYEEADIVKLIAEKKEREGDIEKAVEFYKKAIHRYVNKQLFTNVREIWNKLIEYAPNDIDFFNHVQRKVWQSMDRDLENNDKKDKNGSKAAILLTDLYKYYKDKKDWNTAISILKSIIDYNSEELNKSIRKEIIECYKGKYAKHSHVDEYIKLSNLAQSYRSIHEAMADFEKHIAFDVGNFVYHRTWSIGRIASIVGDDITINFGKKDPSHKMGLKMAVDSLVPLSKNHIWVWKATKPEKLIEKVKNDIPGTLEMIIKSFDNQADMKKIKAELVPSVLKKDSEWTSWSAKAKDCLKTDQRFGNSSDSVNVYIVRDRPLSYEDKVYNQFKAERNFFSRISDLREFVEKGGDMDSDLFTEMLQFFTGFLKAYSQMNEQVIASYLFLKELAKQNPHIKSTIQQTNFNELFEDCRDNIEELYSNIKDTSLKEDLLQNIRLFVVDWADIYVKLFPIARTTRMIEILYNENEIEKLQKMVISIVENYRDHKEAFIWLFTKNLWDEEWVKELNLSYDKILITLIHILDISYKEIDNHKDTTENRRISKQVQNILFKDKRLEKYIDNSEIDDIERIFALISDVKDLDGSEKYRLRNYIKAKYPNFKFSSTEEETTIVSSHLLVTQEKYSEKTKLLEKIMVEDVPANQKEIAFALSLGDLRENAEYKAAKEKQSELNNKVGKLKADIERAQIFKAEDINTNKISFATETLLHNNLKDEDETIIILGPWESDPDNKKISYLSPLGKQLMNKKIGEEIKFTLNKRDFAYTVKEIKAAKI